MPHGRIRSERALINPDEILIDARNLPSYDAERLEGRLVQPIAERGMFVLLGLIGITLLMFGRSAKLMALDGAEYRDLSERNRLSHALVIADRGIIYDRNGVPLAWNEPHVRADGTTEEWSERAYASTTGSAHIVGYVQYPARDTQGVLYRTFVEGVAGAELAYDTMLRGTNGTKIVETDVHMTQVSEGMLEQPQAGDALRLTIDSHLNRLMNEAIRDLAERVHFKGGAGAMMDVRTGEMIALTSYPEYAPASIVTGSSTEIAAYASDARTPYLNRVVSGQYTPGSIVKPFMAAAALAEGIVTPEKTFVSTGALRLENPYEPGQYAVFRDWRAHGTVDMRRAIAVSSDVYFYYIGGGFGAQEGLGITKIHDYMERFGLGLQTGISLKGEVFGTIPSPEWKAQTWPDDPDWRIGNTYHTSIGQYGFQVTPLQSVRAIAAVANGGLLLTPRIETGSTPFGARTIELDDSHLAVAREGMRNAVLEGTAMALNVPYAAVAAKTGTAEVGAEKEHVHSWVVGFFPYENPKYAFVLLMEEGPTGNLYGAPSAMRQFLDRVHAELPQYLE